MKEILFLLIIKTCIFAQSNYNLTINVNNLKNNKGIVQYSLYNTKNSIPDEKFIKYYKQAFSKIDNKYSTYTFKNLSKGIYSINILHDENKNHMIDKGFLLPKEGIGFSKLDSINLLNRPNFTNTSFLLDKNTNINIKINYF